MINAQELRIGNIVKIENDHEYIQCIEEYRAKCCLLGYDKGIFQDDKDIHPIPLTEEWLVRLGFRAIDKYTFAIKSMFIHSRKRGFVHGRKSLEVNIKHVHQLQNLYFALTNEELILKS